MLWASTTWAGKASGPSGAGEAILSAEQQRAIVDEALKLQQADGGWSMASLASWKRVDNSALDTRTDGYATGLIAYVLQATGDSRAKAPVDKALTWL